MTTITVSGAPTHEHIDFAALSGDEFPPSYREFITSAGWARSFGIWLIYPPVLPGYADGLHGRSRHLTERFRESYSDGKAEEFDWMIEPDGTWQIADALTVFGWSENGDALLWDTSARDEHGEFAVWESRGMNSLYLLGQSLSEALPLLRQRAATLSGPGIATETTSVDCEPLKPSLLAE
ncbi:MAG: hypothetical protein KA158_11060 [Leucobacter sp.]|nr:hypothetical protein [Leucobacter sp.]